MKNLVIFRLRSYHSSNVITKDSQRKDLEDDNCMNASKPGGTADTIIENCSEPSKTEVAQVSSLS